MTFKAKLLTKGQNLQDRLLQTALHFEYRRAALKSARVQADGIDYAILQGGNPQGPVLLMIHGFAAEKTNWVNLAALLKQHFHIIIADLAGHGDSSLHENLNGQPLNYHIPTQAQGMLSLMNALGIEKFHVMGNSMGGAIALQMGANAPERLLSMTLMANAGIDGAHQSELFQTLEQGHNPLILREKGDLKKLIGFVMSKPPFMPWPALAVMERKALQRVALHERIFADVMQSRDEMGTPEQMAEILESLSMPVLVIWGAKDRVLDVSCVEVMKQHIANMRSVILPDIGHVAMMEAPKQVCNEFLKFTQTIAPVASNNTTSDVS